MTDMAILMKESGLTSNFPTKYVPFTPLKLSPALSQNGEILPADIHNGLSKLCQRISIRQTSHSITPIKSGRIQSRDCHPAQPPFIACMAWNRAKKLPSTLALLVLTADKTAQPHPK